MGQARQRGIDGEHRRDLGTPPAARNRYGSGAFSLHVTAHKEHTMGLGTILLIVLILLLIGSLPSWGYSSGWGYGPSGGLGLIVVIVIILVLMGRI
jgi:hypothetical protein